MTQNDYYVYVYIDPRNFQEFYYGKGCGSRSHAHLNDENDSDKSARIKAIKSAGQEPIIRIIAANLTEHDAFLVEKTLIWKLGHQLTNKSSGHYAENFRPQDTLHRKLPGFDYANGIYYVNVGECQYRNWDDCREFEFLSAGHGVKWSRQIRQLNTGDVVVAYLKGHGYVGVGRVTAPAVPVRDFIVQGKPITALRLRCDGLTDKCEDDEMSEYPVAVKWSVAKERSHAIWRNNSGLFTTQLVKASLANQPKTLRFVESQWNLQFDQVIES